MADHPNTFHLIVASVGETRFDGAALSATFPAQSGECTILPNHEPFVTTLKQGAITVLTSTGEQSIAIEHGVLECSLSRVTVLL